MQYVVTKRADGTYTASMHLPAGDGSLAAVAKGISAADATVKAARAAGGVAKAAAMAPGASPEAQAVAKQAIKKANTIAVLGKIAQNPTLKNALLSGGIEAAKAAANFVPGGGLVLKALDLAQKFGPAKKLLGSFLKF